ncbi:MAG: hypothetical protein IJW30_06015 [Clostridia bacterium]|nr:hypothetical protein [Clostridia bacterium]MBQ9774203.1 hypothetical protein [Clostridia bacterium]
MARINPQRAFVQKRFSGFSGIGSHVPLGGKGATDVCNFRIRSDGALVLREGSRKLLTLPESPIRGFWEGAVGDSMLCFAVAGSSVYRVSLSDATYTLCTTLDAVPETVAFAVFAGTLYLFDGQQIRFYQAAYDRFAPIQPYVPLYGSNWHPSTGGFANEPLNLLTADLRIHYLNEGGSTTFRLPFSGDAIQSVSVPGKRLTDYTFTQYDNTVTIPSAASYTDVTIAYTVSLSPDAKNEMNAARGALACALGQTEALLLYGTPTGNRVYCSREIPALDMARCQAVYPSALPLYFPESDVLLIGTGDAPIRKILPYRDGLLALNAIGAWNLERDGEGTIVASAAFGSVGISSANAATVCGNTIAVANESGIHLLKSDSARSGALQSECISLPIKEDLTNLLLQNAMLFQNTKTNELWVCRPNAPTGSIRVWSFTREEWYRFRGFAPSLLFCASCGVGYAQNDALYVFDDTLAVDATSPISCYYTGDYMDLDAADTPRRTVRASVCAELHEGSLNLILSTERSAKTFLMKGGTTSPEYFDFRMRAGRHRFLRFRLYAYAPHVGLTIYKTAFYGNR